MFNNLNISNTAVCSCGRKFIIQDIEKLERINDPTFYQGVVKHYSKATCPKCNKKVILLLKQNGQTYEVTSIAEEKTEIVDVVKEKIIVPDKETVIEIEPKETITENNKITNNSNELICPECGKELKTKSGLTNHMKTHQK